MFTPGRMYENTPRVSEIPTVVKDSVPKFSSPIFTFAYNLSPCECLHHYSDSNFLSSL